MSIELIKMLAFNLILAGGGLYVLYLAVKSTKNRHHKHNTSH